MNKEAVTVSIAVEEAASHLLELIKQVPAGEEIILLENDRPVAKVVPLPVERPQAKRGYAKGRVLYMAPDFDAIPEGFRD